MTGPKTLTVQTALAILEPEGATADSVAAELERRGIKGVCKASGRCAIAEYLQSLGFPTPSVGGLTVYVAFKRFDVPWVVTEFIVKFDAGHYPNLIAR